MHAYACVRAPPAPVCVCVCVCSAADVSSVVPLRRSRHGELLMVVTLRWESNHFLGQQSRPHPGFPPTGISFFPSLRRFASKIFCPYLLFSFYMCVFFFSPHHLPSQAPSPSLPPPLFFSFHWTLYSIFITIVREHDNSIVGRLRRGGVGVGGLCPLITRAIKICK